MKNAAETADKLCKIIEEESEIIDDLFLTLMQHISAEEADAQLLKRMRKCAREGDDTIGNFDLHPGALD